MRKEKPGVTEVWLSWMEGPWGPIWVGSTQKGVCGVGLKGEREALERDLACRRPCVFQVDLEVNKAVLLELMEYLEGRRRRFDAQLDPWGSRFDLAVWDALKGIPYGQTCSYGALAKELGIPRGARAVGGAAGRNPIPILIPCHRLIRADGRLGGFGSGIHIKRRLLTIEREGLS